MIAAAVDPANIHDDTGWEWLRVVAHGQRVIVGRCCEERRDGAVVLRIQVPGQDGLLFGNGSHTVFLPLTQIASRQALSREAALCARPAPSSPATGENPDAP